MTGAFALPYANDASGKRVLTQVARATRGPVMPRLVHLGGQLHNVRHTGSCLTQNVTPLSTMITAQMEAGIPRVESTRPCMAFGSVLDMNADYVANGDVATSAIRAQVAQKLTGFASDGEIEPDAFRKVLNAMNTKVDSASLTRFDVDARAAKSVYRLADASQTLAQLCRVPSKGF